MSSKLFNPLVLACLCLVFFLAAVTVSVVTADQNYNHVAEQDWIMSGGVTSSSATFRIRTQGGATFVVSEMESLETRILEETIAASNGSSNVTAISIDSLEANKQYFYATLRNGEEVRTGSFQTPGAEGEAFEFKVAVAGCAFTGAKNEIFRKIAAQDPLFMLHMGDFHYEDISVNDLDLRINAIDMVLGSASQRDLYSQVPLVSTWDDHDWLGNDSGKDESEEGARDTALLSYQIAFPHHPLAVEGDAVPIYHAFTIGTVRFIISDMRSETTSSAIYSEEQRAWLFNELEQAAQYDFVIWATSKPWIGEAEVGEDNWLGQAADRTELSDFISTTLAETQNLLAVSSDAHMLAFDDGSNTYYGESGGEGILSFPILQSGPLSRVGSVKGGPFSDGCHTIRGDENNQYSTISFKKNETGVPCLEINLFDRDDVILTRTLCGKIFTESTPGTGSCELSMFPSVTYALLGVSLGLWLLATVGFCYFLSRGKSACLSLMVLFFFAATLMIVAAISVAKGVPQFNIVPISIIAFCQMLAVVLYCGAWFYFAQKEKKPEDIFPNDNDEPPEDNEKDQS